jgi:hypothetical protein
MCHNADAGCRGFRKQWHVTLIISSQLTTPVMFSEDSFIAVYN